MSHFNLEDYATVAERLEMFWENYPDGQITAEITHLKEGMVVMKATAWRDPGTILAEGHAYEVRGEGHVNATSYIENCETSAVGRALANGGFVAKKDGAPRPSREEMQKVERMTNDPTGEALDLPPNPNAYRDGFDPLDPRCKQCGGAMWDNWRTATGKTPHFRCKEQNGPCQSKGYPTGEWAL